MLFDYRKYKRVLIFTAHPDDLEGFTGGLVKLLCKNNAQIFSVIFSDGDRGRWEKKFRVLQRIDFEDIRVSEAEKAKYILGFKYVDTLDMGDSNIKDSDNMDDLAWQFIQRVQPDLIISFEYHRLLSFYAHPDHLAVANIVKHAVQKHPGNFDYYICTSLRSNYFVNIDKVRKTKMRALSCHKSQHKLNRIIFIFLEYIPCRLWGILNSCRFAEGYFKVKVNN